MPAPRYLDPNGDRLPCAGCPAHPDCQQPATRPPQRCERCWRWTRYNDPTDLYRDQVRNRQSRYEARERGKRIAQKLAKGEV
jgi:hypothetical protein